MAQLRWKHVGLAAALFLLGALATTGSTSAATVLPNGLTVTGALAYDDTTLTVTGELRVVSGGSLALDHVVLVILPNSEGVARLVVDPGASLILRNSEVRAASGEPADAIAVALHGTSTVESTSFHNLAPASAFTSSANPTQNGFVVPESGLLITADAVVFLDVRVVGAAGCGASLVGSSARLAGVSFEAVRPALLDGEAFAAAVCVSGGSPTLAQLDIGGSVVLPPGLEPGSMVAGIVAVDADGLAIHGLAASGGITADGAEPSWSAAILLQGCDGVVITGGEIIGGQNGIVVFEAPGPKPLTISGLTIRALSDTPIYHAPQAYTVATQIPYDNLTIDICGASGVSFTSDGSTAQVTFTLDNVTVSNCPSIGASFLVRNSGAASIHDFIITNSHAADNGQEGFYIEGVNIGAGVNPLVSFSSASRNGATGFRLDNTYVGGTTALASARFDYNTAVNNSANNATFANGGGFWIDLGSPNTLSFRYNNNTALGNVPVPPTGAQFWGHRIDVSPRSSMVISGFYMSGNDAFENKDFGVVLIGTASSRFDIARLRDSEIRGHENGIHGEYARVEVWTSLMDNTREFDGFVTDFVVAGTQHNRLAGVTTGIKTIQSYKMISLEAVWQNDRPISNTSLRFVNGSGSAAAIYSTLTPLTLAQSYTTDSQGRYNGWALDWIFDPNLPASQNQRADYAPLTIGVVPQATESRADPFDLYTNIVGKVTFRDEVGPVIIVQSPRDNGVYTTGNLNVSGVVTDDISGVFRLQVSLDGSNWTDVNRTGGLYSMALPGLTDGVFDIYLRAWDRANEGLASPNITMVVLYAIRIDTQPPLLELVAPRLFDGDVYYTNQPVMVFQGAVDASIVALYMNGIQINPQGSYFSEDAELTSEGPQTFVFLALDSAGNVRDITVTVVRDTFPPTLIIDSHDFATDLYWNSNVVVLSGITDANTNVTVGGINVTVVNGRWVVPFSLNPGRNAIRIFAEDAGGNTFERTIVVYSDIIPPVVTIESLDEGEWVNNTRVVISGTVDETVTFVTIGLFVVPVVDGAYSATIGLVDGPNSLMVRAVDRAGNVGTQTVNITIDTVAPSVTFLGLPDDLTVSNFRIIVRGSVSEAVTLVVNGAEVTLAGFDFDVQVDLAEGPNFITVRATDLAGNEVTIEKRVTLDRQAPAITILVPSGNATVHDGLLRVAGTTEPFATVIVGGHLIPADENGEFEAYVRLAAEGSNVVVIEVQDAAGNSASQSMTVNLAPAVADTTGALVTSLGIAGALVAGLAAAGVFASRKVVGRKVAAYQAARQPAPAPEAPAPEYATPEYAAPEYAASEYTAPETSAPPRPPRAPRPPRPPSV